jgi:hypothetical protein
VSNTLALTRLPAEVKDDLHRGGRDVSRELLMGVAREDDPAAAAALWERLKAQAPSVRAFRAGRPAPPPSMRRVVVAAERLNRSLAAIGSGADIPPSAIEEVCRVLHRTESLVTRLLAEMPASRS